uniref:Uncharacterized protein n=2 Tax=Hemiselmis andersenii TaxID=464988 RepID=A0A6U4Z135_HEMAN
MLRDEVEGGKSLLERAREQEEEDAKTILALREQNKKLLIELKAMSEALDESEARAGHHESVAMSIKRQKDQKEADEEAAQMSAEQLRAKVKRVEAQLRVVSEEAERNGEAAKQLEQAKGVITLLEGRQAELDEMLSGLAHEREHIDEVVQEVKKLRVQVQQKDSLIAEMNEQLHAHTVQAGNEQGESLFKQQQMQRDIHELRSAVQERDSIITDLNSQLQKVGQKGENVRGGVIAEREKAIAEQMQHLQEVAKHQYEMQAQLMEVQQALQDQQILLEDQAQQQAFTQQQQLQMAAQSQQLAALQQSLNSVPAGASRRTSMSSTVHGIANGVPSAHPSDTAGSQAGNEPQVQLRGGLPKTPTAAEWSQEQGTDAATRGAEQARRLARSAAAAASIARRQGGLSTNIPTEVTM